MKSEFLAIAGNFLKAREKHAYKVQLVLLLLKN